MSRFNFFGNSMQQFLPGLLHWNNFLNRIILSRIIEVGTGSGGFTLLLGLYCFERLPLYTFDIMKKFPEKLFQTLNINFEQRDILNRDVNYIRNLIVNPGASLVILDNGNKPREFSLYAPYLKRGDYIAVHDYGPAEFWNYTEITVADIASVGMSLATIMPEYFNPIGWYVGQRR